MKQLNFLTMNGRYNEMEPWQQANIRRSLGEGAALLMLIFLGSTLGFGYDDEEGPESMSRLDWQMLYNIKRVQQELTFFNPLGSSFY